MVTFTPGSTIGFESVPIGSTVLDASTPTPGTLSYTATPTGGSAMAIDATSVLAVGPYTLTVNFVPTDTSTYASASVSATYSVISQQIFIMTAGGSAASAFENGTSQSSGVAGGGIGAAVDAGGYVWSLNAGGGNAVTKFTDTGAFSVAYSGGGINNATALAIDGGGVVWITNSDGTITGADQRGRGPVYDAHWKRRGHFKSDGGIDRRGRQSLDCQCGR